MYIQNRRLSYVVSVTLVNKVEFKEYYLEPVPIPVDKDKLIYINIVKTNVCVDKSRQYYYFSSDMELRECKETIKHTYICKQDKPLQSSVVQDECAVRLLQTWKTLPNSCEVHFVKLTNTVWKQINDNEWIYYVPQSDSITALCNDRDPVDITLKGADKLVLDPIC